MILAMTKNPAPDKTYLVGELTFGVAHCVGEAHAQAGHNGVNATRPGAGVAVLPAGLATGPTGQQIERDLKGGGLDAATHHVEGTSRQTVTVVSWRGETCPELEEQGPELSPGPLSAGPSGPRHWAITAPGRSTTRRRSRGSRPATRPLPGPSAAPSERIPPQPCNKQMSKLSVEMFTLPRKGNDEQ